MKQTIVRLMMLDDRSIAKWGKAHGVGGFVAAVLFLAVSVWIPVHFRVERAPFQKDLDSACTKLVRFENVNNPDPNAQVVATAETIAIHRVNAFVKRVPAIAAIFTFSFAMAFGLIGAMYLRLQQLVNHSQQGAAPAAANASFAER